jgi:mannose-6-phosphate isomerase-like protein (cupin superfamily)
MSEVSDAQGEVLIVRPGEGDSYWQPVPANGFIDVLVAPNRVRMDHPFGFGTQTVPPGSYVREHAHPRSEEVIYFISGQGTAVIDGKGHRVVPGTTLFLGKNRRHKFINDGDQDMVFVWVIVPNGLEDFFKAIGRPRREGEPAPDHFPRPHDVLEIERRTVFAAPIPDSGFSDKGAP